MTRIPWTCRWALAALLVALAATGRAADPPPPAVDVTLPLPDGTVFYVRYGEPGGVQVNSVFVTTDSTQVGEATVPAPAEEVMSTVTAAPAPRPKISAELLRALIREELVARRALSEGRAPASDPAMAEARSRIAELLDVEGANRTGATPGSSLVPGGATVGSTPASVLRVGSSDVGSPAAATTDARDDGAIEALEAMRAEEHAMLTANLDRAKAAVDSLSVLLKEARPEVIREQILEGGLFRTSLILFASARAELAPRSREVIEVVGGVLRDFPELRIRVEGHADARGPADRNLQLSQERAESVAAYLGQCCGVDPSRIEARGYGETQPMLEGDSAADLAMNRRVEFRVLNPDALKRRP